MTLSSMMQIWAVSTASIIAIVICSAIALACLVVAFVLWRRESEAAAVRASSSTGQTEKLNDLSPLPEDEPTAPPSTLPKSQVVGDMRDTDELTDKRTSPIPTREDAEKAEQEAAFEKAADMWRRRGDLESERRAARKAKQALRLANLELALDRPHRALPQLRRALNDAPTDNSIRLRVIETLNDLDQFDEAMDIAGSVLNGDPSSPLKGDAAFFYKVGLAFEGKSRFREAMTYFQRSVQDDPTIADVAARQLYLRNLLRLYKTDPPSAPEMVKRELLSRALEDTDTADIFGDNAPPSDEDSRPIAPSSTEIRKITYHETIVGHLALGGYPEEPKFSVRSVMSRAARFKYSRIIVEKSTTAVFESIDNLLDCPVAIRITRVKYYENAFPALRERLQALASLNHPNITKTTYADRYGPVIRLVTEYHAGGNLLGLVQRLDQLGLPLMLRLLLQISSGLSEAHQHGIIHGDLRAENIMVGHDNLIKIVDFALHPWPVREPASRDAATDSQGNEPSVTPNLQVHEAQTDIAQFAEIMDMMLQRTTLTDNITSQNPDWDPLDEIAEVVTRARGGSFTAVRHIHKILEQILERIVPMGR